MEASSDNPHRRNDSYSSYESVYSADIDEIPVDDLIDEGDDGDDSNKIRVLSASATPKRQRLGAEMAIIAATSPEIKALNLPNSPTFPENMEHHENLPHHHHSNSNDTFSSCSSSTSSSAGFRDSPSRRNSTAATLTPLIASMDDVECSPVVSHEKYGKSNNRKIHNNNIISNKNNNRPKLPHKSPNWSMEEETDELISMLKSSTLKNTVPRKHNKARNDGDNDHSNKKKHVWFNEKENMYSNLLIKTNSNRDYSYKPPKLNFLVGGPRYEYGRGDMKVNNYKKPSSTPNICNRRSSLHRRASCN